MCALARWYDQTCLDGKCLRYIHQYFLENFYVKSWHLSSFPFVLLWTSYTYVKTNIDLKKRAGRSKRATGRHAMLFLPSWSTDVDIKPIYL